MSPKPEDEEILEEEDSADQGAPVAEEIDPQSPPEPVIEMGEDELFEKFSAFIHALAPEKKEAKPPLPKPEPKPKPKPEPKPVAKKESKPDGTQKKKFRISFRK